MGVRGCNVHQEQSILKQITTLEQAFARGATETSCTFGQKNVPDFSISKVKNGNEEMSEQLDTLV